MQKNNRRSVFPYLVAALVLIVMAFVAYSAMVYKYTPKTAQAPAIKEVVTTRAAVMADLTKPENLKLCGLYSDGEITSCDNYVGEDTINGVHYWKLKDDDGSTYLSKDRGYQHLFYFTPLQNNGEIKE